MFQLGEDYIFPHPSNADKHGIVAYGGDLNPLRILDSKDPEDKELLKNAPIIFNFLQQDELESFENVKSILNTMGIGEISLWSKRKSGEFKLPSFSLIVCP